jgi:hypothetical protein
MESEQDKALIHGATPDDAFAKELLGRLIKVECPALPVAYKGNVTFADTGETVPNIRRVELVLDAQTGTASAKLYRWKHNFPDDSALVYAEANSVDVGPTIASIEEVL